MDAGEACARQTNDRAGSGRRTNDLVTPERFISRPGDSESQTPILSRTGGGPCVCESFPPSLVPHCLSVFLEKKLAREKSVCVYGLEGVEQKTLEECIVIW